MKRKDPEIERQKRIIQEKERQNYGEGAEEGEEGHPNLDIRLFCIPVNRVGGLTNPLAGAGKFYGKAVGMVFAGLKLVARGRRIPKWFFLC